MDKDNGIFKQTLLEDSELDIEDIKIGHTYFLGKKDLTEENNAMDFLKYKILYQIKPIYWEYIKDGIIKEDGKEAFRNCVEELLPDLAGKI